MSVQVENLEKSMARLTITVPVEEFEKSVEKAYQRQKKNITLQGFRKGKAPRKMIEKMYGAEIFFEDAANECIQTTYYDELKASGADVVSQPTIEITQLESGKDFIYTATVATRPEVTLGEYKGIKVKDIDVSVNAAEVNAEIDKEREANARTITVEKRGIKKGDIAIIDFVGSVDGVEFEGGKGENYSLEIGSHSFIDNFEDQLVGKKTGEEVDVNVTFPEDYQAAELAGKPALFKVTVNEIKEKQLPKADDEFAQDVSEFDTLKEYKADIKKKLVEAKKDAAKRAQEDEAIEGVIANSTMELPQPMIDSQVDDVLNNMNQQLMQSGLTLEQYMQFTGQTVENMRKEAEPGAIKRIQASLVLEAIVKDAKIKVTEKQLEDELSNMAAAYNMELDKIKELLGEDEKENIKRDIAIQKAVDLIMKNVVVVDENGEEKKAKKSTKKADKEEA